MFNKYDTVNNKSYFRVEIDYNTGQMVVHTYYISQANYMMNTLAFPVGSWEYWAVSVKLNNDALFNDVKIMNGVANSEETIT